MRARRSRLAWAAGVAALAVTAVVATAIATNGGNSVRGNLEGYQEVPAISTAGTGSFSAKVVNVNGKPAINYTLKYSKLEGNVTQAHIHLGQKGVNGGISAFFCSNLGTAGVQACPPSPATVTGTITAADVIGPTVTAMSPGQGIEPGALDELVRAIRRGVTYANVHSSKWPSGEIRMQLRRSRGR